MTSTEHQPPSEIWLGKIDHQWPLQAFVAEGHAIYWLQHQKNDERRRIWKVSIILGAELTLVEPAPYLAPVQPARVRAEIEQAVT